MLTKRTKTAIKVQTGIRGGGLPMNHNRSGLKVRSSVKAGGLPMNHNRSLLSL
jgi:hypothetical protein